LMAPTGVEKTRVAGYYPAPATEGLELAQAVASRSDGKQRMPIEEEENTMRHVATDDKRVLEQLRMGASAPGGISEAGSGEEADLGGLQSGPGPSAPRVEVDELGFERHGDLEVMRDVRGAGVEGLVEPPRPPLQRSLRTFGEFGLSEPNGRLSYTSDFAGPTSFELSTGAPAPSAPPGLAALPPVSAPSAPPMTDVEAHSYLVPSAPPLADDLVPSDDDDLYGDPPASTLSGPMIPGAPSPAPGESQLDARPEGRDDSLAAVSEGAHGDAEEQGNDHRGGEEEPGPEVVEENLRGMGLEVGPPVPSGPVRFLPKYEP
jgi:hypothetical protein